MPKRTATVSNLRLDPRREELAPQAARSLASGGVDPDGLLQDIRWHGRQLSVAGLPRHEHEKALPEETPVIDPDGKLAELIARDRGVDVAAKEHFHHVLRF